MSDYITNVRVISKGWNKRRTRYYGTAAIESAAQAFTAGTQVYFGHRTFEEKANDPMPAGVLIEDARADMKHAKGAGAYSRVLWFKDVAEKVKNRAKHGALQLSIHARGDGEIGERDTADGGRHKGLIVTRIRPDTLNSVDAVGRGGAGGEIFENEFGGHEYRDADDCPHCISEAIELIEVNTMNEEQLKAELAKAQGDLAALRSEFETVSAENNKLKSTAAVESLMSEAAYVSVPAAIKTQTAELVVLRGVPMTESGAIDGDALKVTVAEALKPFVGQQPQAPAAPQGGFAPVITGNGGANIFEGLGAPVGGQSLEEAYAAEHKTFWGSK